MRDRMWSFAGGASSSDGTAYDPALSIFTPPRSRTRDHSQLTAPSTIGASATKHFHIRSSSQSFSPSPLRRSTFLLNPEVPTSLPRPDGVGASWCASGSTSTRDDDTNDHEAENDLDEDYRGRHRLYSTSDSALTTSCSPPTSTTSSHPPPSMRPSHSMPAVCGSHLDFDLEHNRELIQTIRATNARNRHQRRQSDSSAFRTPIQRALGTSEAYDAAAKAALARRLDELTAAVRASSDLSALAVASLHTKLDDLEGTLYDPSSSRACFIDALDSRYDESGEPRKGSALRARPRFARPVSLDFETSPVKAGSAFGSRFSDLSAMLRDNRPTSPIKMLFFPRTGTPTPAKPTIEEEEEKKEKEEEDEDSESDGEGESGSGSEGESESGSEESEDDDNLTEQARQFVPASQGMSIEDARAVVSETEKLNEKLERLINNLRARQEESEHIQTLLLDRAERAAQRIIFLQGRVSYLEDELQENDSDLAYLRLCLKGIEVQVPREMVDDEMWESVQNFKADWKAVKERRAAKKVEIMVRRETAGGG